jgi:hypothetical protein
VPETSQAWEPTEAACSVTRCFVRRVPTEPEPNGAATVQTHHVECREGTAGEPLGSAPIAPCASQRPADDQKEDNVAQTAQMYNGYCVKCKEKRDFEGNVEVSKTGMRMAKGKCPVCGTTVNRILGKA